MKLLAIRPFTYGHRRLEAGERFEATDRDARLLRMARRAHIAPEAAPAPAPAAEMPAQDVPATPAEPLPDAAATQETTMQQLDLTPVEPMTTKDNGALVPTRRGYRRRDVEPGVAPELTAEPAADAADAS